MMSSMARHAASLCVVGMIAWAGAGQASPTEVVRVEFRRSGTAWQVAVTLRHADQGWQHYADLWVVETPGGRELGRRVLFHPHVDEQPFTRSLRLELPPGTRLVRIRAGDNRGGLDSNGVTVDLTRPSGERYRVE